MQSRLIRFVGLVVGVAVTGVSVSAHHSFAAYYNEDQTVTVSGEVQEFQYRSPHAWVYVLAPDEKGQLQRFGAEWGGPGRLSRQGVEATTLKPGDKVVITGAPSREPADRRIHLKRIERPSDGWRWGRQRR